MLSERFTGNCEASEIVSVKTENGKHVNIFQGEERPSEKGEKQLELGPLSGESKLIVPHFQISFLSKSSSSISSWPLTPRLASPPSSPSA